MLAPHVLEENYMFLLSAAVAAFAHIATAARTLSAEGDDQTVLGGTRLHPLLILGISMSRRERTYDLVSSEMLSGLDAAASWSKFLGKEIAYAGHGDFDRFEAQLGKHSLFKQTFEPLWLGTKILLGRANMPA